MFKNEYVITADIKRKMTDVTPTFVQYDSAELVFRILDNGKPFDISNITRVEVSHKRPDGKTIIGVGVHEKDSNNRDIIRYKYMGNEMRNIGFVDAAISIFEIDKKVSVFPFTVRIVTDLRDGLISPASEEYGVLQELIVEVGSLVSDSSQAVTDATKASQDAEKAVLDAQSAISDANLAKDGVVIATQNAEDATNTTIQIRESTLQAKTNAETATTNAQVAADNANNVASLTQQAIDSTNAASVEANTARDGANQAALNADTVRLGIQSIVDESKHIGEYSNTTQYHKNNEVRVNGSSYVAIVETKGNRPPVQPEISNEYWELRSQRGIDGLGSVATVNGRSPDTEGNVLLDSFDVGAIGVDEKGVAGGIAKLNSDGKVVDATGNLVEGKVTSVNGEIGDVVLYVPTNDEFNLHVDDSLTHLSQEDRDRWDSATYEGHTKLLNYEYVLTATQDNQTEFTIPLVTFDDTTDAILINHNRVPLSKSDYTIVDRLLILNDSASIGDTLSLFVIKQVVADYGEGYVSGNVISKESMPLDRLNESVVKSSEKGVNSGVAILDANGKLLDGSGNIVENFSGKYADLTGKPELKAVATSGNYDDLLNKPNASGILVDDINTHFTSSNVEGVLEELFTSVSSGKLTVATAITDKGIITSGSDTFNTMAINIGQIQGGVDTSDATAYTGDILSGKTAYVNDSKITGTMSNQGARTFSPSPYVTSIPEGYYNGNGVIDPVAFDSSKVLNGTTIAGILGTMPNQGSIGTVNPTTSNRNYSAGHYNAFAVAGSSSLVASNIRSGANIFGVSGNYAGAGLNFYNSTMSINFTSSYSQFDGYTLNMPTTTFTCGFQPKFWGFNIHIVFPNASHGRSLSFVIVKQVGQYPMATSDYFNNGDDLWYNGLTESVSSNSFTISGLHFTRQNFTYGQTIVMKWWAMG